MNNKEEIRATTKALRIKEKIDEIIKKEGAVIIYFKGGHIDADSVNIVGKKFDKIEILMNMKSHSQYPVPWRAIGVIDINSITKIG